MSAIVPPPAYSEAPSEDLVAELAKMKAMMEQMRLEKELMETEARRKAEEEAVSARIRTEQEEARELAEIHKKLNQDIMTQYDNPYGIHKHAAGAADQKALEQIKASGEIILYVANGTTQDPMGSSSLNTIDMIITNRNVYYLYFSRTRAAAHIHYTSGLRCSALYTFDNPLNTKQTKMLTILDKGPSYHSSYMLPNLGHSIMYSMRSFNGNHYNYHNLPLLSNVVYMDARKKFESVIRLIPGSYKNGDWRQLDGFFGMYFNETTMEVSEVPPPSI
jgi:hypothetical protein